jgi:Tfp pilus assembly protein PilF
MTPSRAMKQLGLAAFLIALASPAPSVPLQDSVSLNIGINCQWQKRCIDQQHRAMKRALSYVRKAQPAAWRIQRCNRNAARLRHRVDWIGFENCIRNTSFRMPPRSPLRSARKVA